MVDKKWILSFPLRVNDSDLIVEGKEFEFRHVDGDAHLFVDGNGVSLIVLDKGVSVFFNTLHTFSEDIYTPGKQALYIADVFKSLGAIFGELPGLNKKDVTTILNTFMNKMNNKERVVRIRWKGYMISSSIKPGLVILSITRTDEDEFWTKEEI